MDWKDKVIEMRFKEKAPEGDIIKYVLSVFPDLPQEKARDKFRGIIRRHPDYKPTESKPVKPKIQPVYESTHPEIIRDKWSGNQIIRFGLIGDTHINSKYTQLTHLHDFYDRCARLEIPTVYLAGDIDEGERMRLGHQYECYNQGADEHVAEILRVYPKRDGITTRFITGNHDASMIKHCGYDIGPAIARERKDMEYLGKDWAKVFLTPNCTLELRHPWDGCNAYATSYKVQKMVEAMEADSKPNILAVAHYHKLGDFTPRNVHAFMVGAFQSQTPFSRGKGLSVEMGGYIIEAEVDERGTIVELVMRKQCYYAPIQDDWKNWRR